MSLYKVAFGLSSNPDYWITCKSLCCAGNSIELPWEDIHSRHVWCSQSSWIAWCVLWNSLCYCSRRSWDFRSWWKGCLWIQVSKLMFFVSDMYYVLFCFCSLYLVFPARTPSANVTELAGLGISPSVGRHAGTQAGYQLALLASTLTISIVGGLLTGK